MDKYTYGDEESKYNDDRAPNNFGYIPNSNLAIDTKTNDFTMDYTRSNTKLIMQITKTKSKKFYLQYIKDLKKWFKKWRKQYDGLTFSESIFKFIYNLSHTGITIATIIYCIIFIIVTASTAYSNYVSNNEYNIEYIIIGINCMIGIISLLFNILPIILIFDYILSCGGIGFTLSASWKINDGYNENGNNSTLVIFGLIMILIVPFRIFWWHKYYPNKYIAQEMYTILSQQGFLQHTDINQDEEEEDDVDTNIISKHNTQSIVKEDSMFY